MEDGWDLTRVFRAGFGRPFGRGRAMNPKVSPWAIFEHPLGREIGLGIQGLPFGAEAHLPRNRYSWLKPTLLPKVELESF